MDIKAFKKESAEKHKAEKEAEPKSTGTPWYINMFMWFIDALAAVGLLALALIGARTFIDSNMNSDLKTGIACVVVGLLAVRLLERIFRK